MNKIKLNSNSYKLNFDLDGNNKGIFSNCFINNENELVLSEGKLRGYLITSTENIDPFKKLLVSWKGKTNENNNIEVLVQVKREDSKWSEMMSLGKWTIGDDRAGGEVKKNKVASINIDNIRVNDELYGIAVRFKIILSRQAEDVPSPLLNNLYISLYNKHYYTYDFKDNYKTLDVTPRSQRSVIDIGDRICSPTSISMVLSYYDYDLSTEIVAQGVFDSKNNIYGNWSFNTAFANEMGLSIYPSYMDNGSEIIRDIINNKPVICSIKTKDSNELTGSAKEYPSGHLVVVCGITNRNGEDYFVVNDPAFYKIDEVKTLYKYDEFIKAWSGVSYVIE